MLRNLAVSVLAPVLVAPGCARHTIPQVTLIPQTRLGTEDFGPGIVSYGSQGMDFALDASAHVIVLRVSDAARVEAVRPLGNGDRTELARGKHHVMTPAFRFMGGLSGYRGSSPCTWGSISPYTEFAGAFDSTAAFRQAASTPSYDTCVRHELWTSAMFRLADGTTRRGEPPTEVYWLLIVSDVPTDAADLRERLAPLEWPGSASTAVRSLPEVLVGARTSRWAAYYVLLDNTPRRKLGN